MFTHNFLFGLVFSLLSSVLPDEDYYHVSGCCVYRGPHFEQTEYINTFHFNNHIRIQYNSTRGYWIGFTPYAINDAKHRNNDLNDTHQRQMDMMFLCKSNVKYVQGLGNLTTPPTIKLKSLKPPDSQHPAILVCSAYDFYPKQIQLTWLRNGQEVREGIVYSDVRSNGDLYYQIESHLEYTPTSEETITCMVEHVSLSKPRLVDWDDSLSVDQTIHVVVSLGVLMLGLVVLSTGFIYYRKKRKNCCG